MAAHTRHLEYLSYMTCGYSVAADGVTLGHGTNIQTDRRIAALLKASPLRWWVRYDTVD